MKNLSKPFLRGPDQCMRDVLICTVGTSLIGNISRAGDADLGHLLETRNAKGLAVKLASFAPDEHILGAEINSIHGILSQGLMDARTLVHFLVSDSDEGRFIGSVLCAYFQSSKNPDRFEKAGASVIEGLSDRDINLFRNTGLKNLVLLIADNVRKYGAERILINATGGYKAQISFAGMIGQALDIPVCYLFEKFSAVIQLPPQPVALDLSFWIAFADTFFELAATIEGDAKWQLPDERFTTLTEGIDVGGRHLQTLSPTGQLFHETFRYRFMRQKSALLPEDSGLAPNEKKIRFEDNNAGKHQGLEHHLRRILKAPYIKEIYTHYYNTDLTRPTIFRRSAKGILNQVEGQYANAGAMTKFDVITTARSEEQQGAVIADLNEQF